MPEYDFFCAECKRKFTQFVRYEDYGKAKIHCALCGQANVRRLINRVRFARSEESRMESLSEFSGMGDLAEMEKDPRALGKMMRHMSKEVGEEMGPEFNEVVDRLEKGQNADEIERDLPDIGGELDE